MIRARARRSRAWIWIWVLALLGSAESATATTDERLERLSAEERHWLEGVAYLISDEETAAFLDLTQAYQRQAFIEEFWRVRDPYPDTARNELRERWSREVADARRLFGDLGDKRAEIYLTNGAPTQRFEVTCRGVLHPVEAWFYERQQGRRNRGELALLFYRRWGAGNWRLWDAWGGTEVFFDRLSAGGSYSQCHFEEFQEALRRILMVDSLGYAQIVAELEEEEEAPREWVPTFAAYSTDLPAGAATFPATLEVAYPGHRGQRTVLQGVVAVEAAELTAQDLGGYRSHSFVLNGEIVRGGELFENFRYEFTLPAVEGSAEILPLAFQRYLRPGSGYELVLRVEELASGRFFQQRRALEVPRLENAAPAAPAPEVDARLAEANRLIAGGEVSIDLVQPVGQLQTGYVRFETQTLGAGIDRVVFSLDSEPILTKARPPYSVELDLGSLPQVHTLRATAFDEAGRELDSDEILINSGGHRFRVRLTEPAPGLQAVGGVRARAAVEVPDGESLERVELFVNEERRATLYGPPFVQPLTLPPGGEATYLRAVAYLADGRMDEDVVWVNAPPGLSDETNVRLVELYTTVLDRERRPLGNLEPGEFRVLEDGVEQSLERFERLADLPFHGAILLDVSASMADRLATAQQAALSFFRQAVEEQDRLALITFNDRPSLAARFTHRLAEFGAGLAGLHAERSTALYDSLIYSLFYFNGITGQRVLLLLSDGKDEGSRFGFEEALEYARRSGVTLYAVGLDLPRRDGGAKRRLTRLARETGGREFFIESADQLAEVYAAIEEELRSRYLLAYYSSNTSGDEGFRRVEVEVERRGVSINTLRGYYP